MDKEIDNSQDIRISISDAEANNENELTKKDDVRAKIKKVFYPWGQHHNHLMWKNIFLVSCVTAISIDPLFLYIPYINEEKKCIQMNTKLKSVFLVYRCVTDISYLIHIIYYTLKSVRKTKNTVTMPLRKTKNSGLIGKTSALFGRIPWSFILNIYIDILAIIPLPQMMLVFFAKLKESRYLSTRTFLNVLVISQYAPRILRVYLLWRKLGRMPSSITGVVWVSGAFNLFLYIVASHSQALQNMDGRVIEIFINHLKPVVYAENTYIIRNGEPLDLMLLITQGVVWTFKTGSKTIDNCFEKGDFYGEELLNWALKLSTTFAQVPISTTNVKCHTKVEAFYHTAFESKNLVGNYWWLFRKHHQLSTRSETKRRFEPLAVYTIERTWLRGIKSTRKRNGVKKISSLVV